MVAESYGTNREYVGYVYLQLTMWSTIYLGAEKPPLIISNATQYCKSSVTPLTVAGQLSPKHVLTCWTQVQEESFLPGQDSCRVW